MRQPLREWTGEKHPDHDSLIKQHTRVGQVWLDNEDSFAYYFVDEPRVYMYDPDGRPLLLEHSVQVIDLVENTLVFPSTLTELVDRPFEVEGTLTIIS